MDLFFGFSFDLVVKFLPVFSLVSTIKPLTGVHVYICVRVMVLSVLENDPLTEHWGLLFFICVIMITMNYTLCSGFYYQCSVYSGDVISFVH